MRIKNNRLYCLTLATLLALLPLGCGDESENSIQANIDKLMMDIDIAISESNPTALDEVISSALRLRPSSPTQGQSKHLLLATARSKAAQMKFNAIASQVTLVSDMLSLAARQSTQVAMLRAKATSLSETGLQQGEGISQSIIAALTPASETQNARLLEVTTRIARLETQSQAGREKAAVLRATAEELFEAADIAGLLEGHKTFKSGVVTIRQSQHIDMSAAGVELETMIQEMPERDDTKAELESIALILKSMQQTQDLLRRLRASSIQSAATLRQAADELDNETANMMSDAIDASSDLLLQWDNITTMISDALQGSVRSGKDSRETQQANATWKFDLTWTLGRIEEAKRNFLIEESSAINLLIHNEIVTSSSKWQELSATTMASIEKTTSSSIAAYERAKQEANKAGNQVELLANQLDARIAKLQGKPIIIPADTRESSQPTTSTPLAGFHSAQEVITAFNEAPSFDELDGTAPAINLALYYAPVDETAAGVLASRQSMLDAGANLLLAIHSTMGAAAVQEFKQSLPPSAQDKVDIASDTLQRQGDIAATAVDINGGSVALKQTSQGWKIVFGSNSDEMTMNAMMQDMIAPMVQAMQLLADQINDGQITTIEQLNMSLGSAIGG